MRHNDNDDLTLFDWDGESWHIPFENRNMVHHDDFDLLEEAEWDAVGSGNFFVTRRPKVDNIIEIPYICWPKFKRWGIKWKCKYVRVWSETHPGANIELFERQNDGGWIRHGEVNTDDSKSEKHLVVGSNWYIEKRSNKAYLWDGVKWNEEKLNINWSYFKDIHNPSGQGPTMVEVFDESYTIGDFFAVEGAAETTEAGTTTIYYKKNDSFVKNKGVLLVGQKTVHDPIVDKKFSYKYVYNFDNALDVAFDYVNNTPLIKTVRIELPDNSGMIERELCPIDHDSLGLGLGKICSEKTFVGEVVEKSSISRYSRYRNSNWPNLLHVDAVSSVETYIKGVKSKDSIEYNIALNGLPSRKLFFENGSNDISNEQVLRYSAEEYAFERNENHLRNPLLSYSCKPNCTSGKVVQATAARYAAANDSIGIPHLVEEWAYNPEELVNGNSFQGIPWALDANPSAIWKKNSEISKYWNGFANAGISHEDMLSMNWGNPANDNSTEFQELISSVVDELDDAYFEIKRDNDAISVNDIMRDLQEVLMSDDLPQPDISMNYLFIDEFQDSDLAQIKVATLLVKLMNAKLFVVGDVKQSIYRFRGATDQAFDILYRDLSDVGAKPAKNFILVNNYRTAFNIMNRMNTYFAQWGADKLLKYDGPVIPFNKESGIVLFVKKYSIQSFAFSTSSPSKMFVNVS